jgi:hypothetical protein
MDRTRRELLAGGAALVAGAGVGRLAWPPAAGAQSPAPQLSAPLGDADYWAFADWAFGGIDGEWNPANGYGLDPRINAAALVAHSVAAMTGHTGPTRQDERARQIAARLLQSPPFKGGRPSGSSNARAPSQAHSPGWVGAMDNIRAAQQIAIDPKVAEGLVFAWRAREALALPADTVTGIRDSIVSTAQGPFFRYPGIRLNQINWPCELYTYAAEVSGSPDLLRNDFRLQLERFLRGARRPTAPWATTNFSPSWSFHRDPLGAVASPENLEAPEYIGMILEILLFYPAARAAGMPAPSGPDMRALRAIVTRALSAYWTHAGYLNWDTGLYRLRWHLGRYWGLALQGLFAIAQADEVRSGDEGAWAKWMFDRALVTYVRLALERGRQVRIPRTPLYNVTTTFGVQPSDFAARFLMHAARAVHYGFAQRPARQPPPLYAFDPGIGRLAVTTPAYNTAVMATSNGAFPYGGLEPARLFDAEQRVVGGIGGYGAAGFGAIVRNSRGSVLETQRVKRRATTPIELVGSPRGRVRAGQRYPARPYAGPFERLRYSGEARAEGARVEVMHTFESDRIVCTWTFTREGGGELAAEVRFPTWGGDAAITAIARGGDRTRVRSGRRRRLDGIRRIELASGEGQSGYALVVRSAPSSARLTVARVGKQTSNPSPGASLVVELAPLSDWRRLRFAVELIPGLNA